MEIDLPNLAPALRYQFLTSVVTPRPIAWVTSQSTEGVANAAPFSFFNVFGSKPPLIVLGIGNRPDTGEPKDTVRNIKRSGQFVVHTVSTKQAQVMVQTSTPLPRNESELSTFGLETIASKKVAPPRIVGAQVALECETHSIQEIGQNRLIIAKVIHAFVADEHFDAATEKVLPDSLSTIGRTHGPDGYCYSEATLKIDRPS